MNKWWLTIATIVGIFVLSGCMGPDAQGWHYDQKREFMQIVKEDTYFSLCGDDALLHKVEESGDSRLMSRLLVRYAQHLANGCIDTAAFKAAQKARESDDFKTHYELYEQKVDPVKIEAALRAGASIAAILKPYVPRYREFERLGEAYRAYRAALRSGDGNVSRALLRKIRLNIERVKLMKPLRYDNYALINIPEFKVRIVEKDKTVVAMRVITGKRNMQTPIFGENLKYIVLNPQWNVPESIMRKEMIPKALKNPSYLKRHHFVVRRDYNLDSPEVAFDPTVAKQYLDNDKPIPFRFIQPPSKRNGLGRVKFLFPNRFSVYMHDTQAKSLFKRKVRTFSHGCVRLAEPYKMLRYLVEHYTHTSWEEAKKMYDSYETHFITLSKPLPVHTAYLTVYIDDDGKLREFPDIYGYDKIQHLVF